MIAALAFWRAQPPAARAELWSALAVLPLIALLAIVAAATP